MSYVASVVWGSGRGNAWTSLADAGPCRADVA